MLLGFFMISFVVAVAFGSFFVYQQAREAAWAMPADVGVTTVVDLPAVILPSVAPEGAPQKPVAALPGAVVPRIDGEFNPVPAPVVEPAADKRITVLLLGVDQRPDDPNPPRTDNMIVLTLNLSSGQAGMISLPRDLFVPIPGFDQSGKINTAYVVGESNDYPGGGGALAKKTVSDFLGYPIDYYAKVNFDGFVRAIDLIGGVDVDVAATIHDEQYPTIDYGVTTFHIDAGRQHLDGDTALKYVRTRHADSDFERARRQQQVLLAAKDKVMKNKLATTFQLLDFIDVLSSSIEHDVPTADLLDLAGLALKVQVDDIDQLVLDSQYGQVDADSAYGWILLPDRNKIRPAVDQIFISAEQPQQVNLEALARQRAQQQAELAQQQAELARQQVRNNYQAQAETLRRQLGAEAARIVVYDGTGDPVLAARTTDWLRKQGYDIVEFGEADRTDYPRTVLLAYNDKPFTASNLCDTFAIADHNVRVSNNPDSDVDLRLIIGRDFYLLVSN